MYSKRALPSEARLSCRKRRPGVLLVSAGPAQSAPPAARQDFPGGRSRNSDESSKCRRHDARRHSVHSRRGGAGCLRHPLAPPFLHFQNQEGRRDWPGPCRGGGEPHICKARRGGWGLAFCTAFQKQSQPCLAWGWSCRRRGPRRPVLKERITQAVWAQWREISQCT